MPRRTKQAASQGGSTLKRQKRVGGNENMSEGAGSGLSTPAAPEDSGRGLEAASVPNSGSKPEGTSITDSSITEDGGVSKVGGVTSTTDGGDTSATDSGVSKVGGVTSTTNGGDTSTTDNGAFKEGGVTSTTDNGAFKEGGVASSTDGGVSKEGGVTSTTDSGIIKNRGIVRHGSLRRPSTAEVLEEYRGLADFKVKEMLALPIYYTADDEVADLFAELGEEIKVVATLFFPRDARPWETLGADIQEKLKRWSPNAKRMLESSPTLRAPLYTAWIWHILDDNLFSIKGTGKLSRNEFWDCYHKLQHVFHKFWDYPAPSDNLRDHLLVKYHFWKQITLELMQYDKGIEEVVGCATTSQITDLIESELGPSMDPLDKPGDPRNTLDHLASLAITLYCKMNASAAQWLITFGHPQTGQLSGFPFDEKVMQHRGPEKAGLVDLVLQPLLQIRGGQDGLHYDCVEKWADMVVLVDWPALAKLPFWGRS